MEAGDTVNGNVLVNGKGEDVGDALGNTRLPKKNVVAHMPTDRNARFYKMNHEKRGVAIIFNHEFFKVPGLKARAGTQVDCKNFVERLKKLHFDVFVYNDLELQHIQDKIQEVTSMDYSSHDCFLLAVLTHGEMGILYAKDKAYKPDSLWNPFTSDVVPSLAGKPKLFFIQACQGDQLDGGVTLSRTETDGVAYSYRIPSHADFLIAYSTIPAMYSNMDRKFASEVAIKQDQECTCACTSFYSWRNTTRGSWFIQALCDELEENGFEFDLLTLLTFVCQRVALDYESNTPDIPHMHAQKQIPCITTMLTRLVKFTRRF